MCWVLQRESTGLSWAWDSTGLLVVQSSTWSAGPPGKLTQTLQSQKHKQDSSTKKNKNGSCYTTLWHEDHASVCMPCRQECPKWAAKLCLQGTLHAFTHSAIVGILSQGTKCALHCLGRKCQDRVPFTTQEWLQDSTKWSSVGVDLSPGTPSVRDTRPVSQGRHSDSPGSIWP